jgi:hypothetical protein
VAMTIDPVLSSRIKVAWNALSAGQQQKMLPLLQRANARLNAAARGEITGSHDEVEHVLMFGLTVLYDDPDDVLGRLSVNSQGGVDGNGAIWGTARYEQLDPGWLESFAEWLEHLIIGRHGFVEKPVTYGIPRVATIGIAGDWGTGDWRGDANRASSNPAPSTRVRLKLSELAPALTVHLGDVYYAGTGVEEQHLLTRLWPTGSQAAATLNSNHEMYSGAGPYYKAIARAPFDSQGGCSYFSCENDDWVIVGLDSAYFSDEAGLYDHGALFDGTGNRAQVDFLEAQARKGKRIIVLTHHNGLSPDGTRPTLLWQHVTTALRGAVGPVYWYWGHVHSAVVYQPTSVGDLSMQCRCCGHGGLPGGPASVLNNHEGTVQWYERRSAGDIDIPVRILNGFAAVHLDGPTITETFYDENGDVAWSS